MIKKEIIYLKHILDAIDLLDGYLQDKSFNDFKNSIQLQDSVIRRLEIIGEVVKNLPQKVLDMNRDIPWKEIAGMRDILIHRYFGVDLGLTWKAVKEDNPKIKPLILKMLKELESS